MKEILISSAFLIAGLLLLRFVFRKAVSRRVQYALWALVLLRLLVPASLPPFFLSVQNVGRAIPAAVAAPENVGPAPSAQETAGGAPGTGGDAGSLDIPDAPSGGPAVRGLLPLVWKCGMIAAALWFLTGNLLFWLKLRKWRTPYPAAGSKKPVYLCPKLPAPCLFGFPKAAIYLTPAATESEQTLRHVLIHEETHARHLDPLWSLLRCACLTVYWFDPLVWLAAAASKTDCELACDETALRLLGKGEHIAYGRTLLSLVPVRRGPVNPLLSSTAMTSGKRQLRDRIGRIAANRRTAGAAMAAALIAALLLTACAFTGGQNASPGPSAAVVLPSGAPDAAIPLVGALEPYSPETLDTPAIRDFAGELTTPVDIGDYEVFYCRDDAGGVWAAYRGASEEVFRIREVYWYPYEEGNADVNTIEPFTDVLGYDGFSVGCMSGEDFTPYRDGMTGNIYTARCYYFFDGGRLRSLAQTAANMFEDDLDGDGSAELMWYGTNAAQLYFRADGGLYRADIDSLLRDAYPDWDYMELGVYDTEKHAIILNGYKHMALAKRYLYFDGDSLLSYKDTRTAADHVMSGIDVPADVLDAAKSVVSEWLEAAAAQNPDAGYDDWRVESLTYAYTYDDFYGKQLELYNMNHEFHASAPDKVMLAGGSYVKEDGWAMLGYPYCTYLIFEVRDGTRVYLCSTMENDCSPGSETFTSDLRYRLLDLDLLSLSGFSGGELLRFFSDAPDAFQKQLDKLPEAEQADIRDKLAYYKTNGYDRPDSP